MDHDRHEALIAFEEKTGEPLGVGRYVRYSDDPADAEPAVTVVDHWQGRGLGSILLEEITDRARAAGVERFTAVVLASNKPMLAMLEHFGTDLETTRDGGVLTIETELPAEGSAPPLHAALRDAAAERLAGVMGSIFDLGRATLSRGRPVRRSGAIFPLGNTTTFLPLGQIVCVGRKLFVVNPSERFDRGRAPHMPAPYLPLFADPAEPAGQRGRQFGRFARARALCATRRGQGLRVSRQPKSIV